MSSDVFMSVLSLKPVESVLWKIMKYSEMANVNEILLFKPVAIYML